jgi:hypothetical protein
MSLFMNRILRFRDRQFSFYALCSILVGRNYHRAGNCLVSESQIIEELRKRTNQKHLIHRIIFRVLQIAAIVSAICIVWTLRPLLVSTLLLANSKLSILMQQIRSLRF